MGNFGNQLDYLGKHNSNVLSGNMKLLDMKERKIDSMMNGKYNLQFIFHFIILMFMLIIKIN